VEVDSVAEPRVFLWGFPSETVEEAWPQLEGHLIRAMVMGGADYTIEDIKRWCLERRMQLWGLKKDGELVGAGVTEVVDYPKKRIVRIVILSGGTMAEWAVWQWHFEQWAKGTGATSIQALARKGFHRLAKPYGYRHLHEVIARDL
jgi:hypothetical protein